MNEKVMRRLGDSIGKRIRVEYVEDGKVLMVEGKLIAVQDFRHIRILPLSGVTRRIAELTSQRLKKNFNVLLEILFIGKNHAIMRITGENDETLYENPLISPDYSLSDLDEINEMTIRMFGEGALRKIQQYETRECEQGKMAEYAERLEDWRLLYSVRTAIRTRMLQMVLWEKPSNG